jgi:hypothetical protein
MPEIMDPFGLAAGQDGIRLLAVLIGAALGTSILFMPRRRRIPVERPIEPEPERERTEEDSEPK